VELEGRETSERRVPSTFEEEAYELRDASATSEERDYYQERVYRLRGGQYRSRGVRFEESARRIERSRSEALRAGDQYDRLSWWKREPGRGRSEKRGLQAGFSSRKLSRERVRQLQREAERLLKAQTRRASPWSAA
jgi:hypothetical protein